MSEICGQYGGSDEFHSIINYFFLFIAFGGFDPLGLRDLVAKTI